MCPLLYIADMCVHVVRVCVCVRACVRACVCVHAYVYRVHACMCVVVTVT